jgi:hypothetical protein
MNTPHLLNKPLPYMAIPDSSYGWQEKMFSTQQPGAKIAPHTPIRVLPPGWNLKTLNYLQSEKPFSCRKPKACANLSALCPLPHALCFEPLNGNSSFFLTGIQCSCIVAFKSNRYSIPGQQSSLFVAKKYLSIG